MVDNEIIRPSTSPWNSPVILIKEKDSSTRLVCDFLALNDIPKKNSHLLPHIRGVIDKMESSKYWTTLDAASIYWWMPLAEEDKEKTAFSVSRENFEFNVTPYGLCNTGVSYQQMIDICLAGSLADRVLAYMDDIVIFSSTFAEHISSLESVFQCLRLAGITLKSSKCIFGSEKVDFLDCELSAKRVRPQKHLTEAICSFQLPESKKEVKRFLGLAEFYRNFIEDFSKISKPFNKLTSDSVVFHWNSQAEEAFNKLKAQSASEPVLAFL